MKKLAFGALIACAFTTITFVETHAMGMEKNQAPAPAAKETVSDLRTSVQEALHTNPEILIQKAERDVSDHKVSESIGAYFPVLDLRAGAGKEYVKQAYSRNVLTTTETRGSTNKTRYDPSATITQKIFDGLETPYDIKKSKKELFQSVKNIEEAQVLIAFNAIDKYISVRRFERLLKLSKDNVQVHKSILAKIKKLVAAGKVTSGDEKNVLSRLHDAEAAVGDIQGDLDSAYANFKEVVGRDAYKLNIPIFNDNLIPGTVQTAIMEALKKNRSVIVARATEDVARADFDKSISPFMPAVDLQLQARRDYDVGGKSGVLTNLTGQFIGTFNVYNGGRDIAKRRGLRAKMQSAKFRKYQEMRRAEKEVRVSYAELLSARVQSIALRGAVKSKKTVREIYMKQFDAGTRSFLDILDASHEYFLAKGSLITSDATEDLAAARLLASVGTLLELFDSFIGVKEMKNPAVKVQPVAAATPAAPKPAAKTSTKNATMTLKKASKTDTLERIAAGEEWKTATHDGTEQGTAAADLQSPVKGEHQKTSSAARGDKISARMGQDLADAPVIY